MIVVRENGKSLAAEIVTVTVGIANAIVNVIGKIQGNAAEAGGTIVATIGVGVGVAEIAENPLGGGLDRESEAGLRGSEEVVVMAIVMLVAALAIVTIVTIVITDRTGIETTSTKIGLHRHHRLHLKELLQARR